MENKKEVIGYKPLTDEQKELMNRVKALGNELGDLLDDLYANEETDKRSLAIAKTEIQTGLMWANRAIAKPSTFC